MRIRARYWLHMMPDGKTAASQTWKQEGNKWVSNGRTMPAEAFEELQQAILNSRDSKILNPAEFGVTAEWWSDNQKLVEGLIDAKYPQVLPILREQGFELSFADAVSALSSQLIVPEANYQHQWTEVKITTNPKIELTSAVDSPLGLPWTVEIGKESFKTYSGALPRLLRKWMSPRRVGAFISDEDNWTPALLDKKVFAWEAPLTTKILSNARNMIKSLSAGTSREPVLKIVQARAENGSFNLLDENSATGDTFDLADPKLQLTVAVPSAGNRVIDSIQWINHFRAGKLTGVDDLLPAYNEAEEVLKEFSWLHEWKNAAKGRSVTLLMEDTLPGPKRQEIETAWNVASKTTTPTISIALKSHDYWVDSWILFSPAERKFVLFRFSNIGEGEKLPVLHWRWNASYGYFQICDWQSTPSLLAKPISRHY